MNKSGSKIAETLVSRAGLLSGLTALSYGGAALAQGAAERYVVDPARSDVHWLVYSAGPMARLGHNHTVAVGDLAGDVMVNRDDLAKSQFDLQFSAANLVVDDPALRSTLGERFASVPSAEDIAGTRSNMLSERVLQAEKHPQISLVGTGPAMVGGAQELAVTVEILGRTVNIKVPTTVTIDGEQLHARGEFDLNHADLGMQPFSVMMGALQVGEQLSFSYDVTARRAGR
jgi:polyisoprenoid-binding protein YceI